MISDGAAGRTLEDFKRVDPKFSVSSLPGVVMFEAIKVTTGDKPSTTLEDLMPDIDSPTLLVSGGTALERDANVLLDAAAGDNVEHWNLPEAGHTSAVRDFPREYEARVTAYLADELDVEPGSTISPPARPVGTT